MKVVSITRKLHHMRRRRFKDTQDHGTSYSGCDLAALNLRSIEVSPERGCGFDVFLRRTQKLISRRDTWLLVTPNIASPRWCPDGHHHRVQDILTWSFWAVLVPYERHNTAQPSWLLHHVASTHPP